jgi:hypothetical protein
MPEQPANGAPDSPWRFTGAASGDTEDVRRRPFRESGRPSAEIMDFQPIWMDGTA